MDEMSRKINAYLAAAQQAKISLQERTGIELESLDIQKALQEILATESDNPAYLLNHELTTDQILELLKDYNFRKLKPELLAVITLDEPLIPEGIYRPLLEQTVKVSGEVWRIHKSDADDFPSVPHAHNLETGAVLHLGTGDLYDRNRKPIKNVGCKALLRIRGQLTKFDLPATHCS